MEQTVLKKERENTLGFYKLTITIQEVLEIIFTYIHLPFVLKNINPVERVTLAESIHPNYTSQ